MGAAVLIVVSVLFALFADAVLDGRLRLATRRRPAAMNERAAEPSRPLPPEDCALSRHLEHLENMRRRYENAGMEDQARSCARDAGHLRARLAARGSTAALVGLVNEAKRTRVEP
ncbi:MAG: hypothetical protein KC457_28045 [Myxococcales bacterium]|nr:hypothetical protein [Myxococcales bacterium]